MCNCPPKGMSQAAAFARGIYHIGCQFMWLLLAFEIFSLFLRTSYGFVCWCAACVCAFTPPPLTCSSPKDVLLEWLPKLRNVMLADTIGLYENFLGGAPLLFMPAFVRGTSLPLIVALVACLFVHCLNYLWPSRDCFLSKQCLCLRDKAWRSCGYDASAAPCSAEPK
jgi:hypothetical protein